VGGLRWQGYTFLRDISGLQEDAQIFLMEWIIRSDFTLSMFRQDVYEKTMVMHYACY